MDNETENLTFSVMRCLALIACGLERRYYFKLTHEYLSVPLIHVFFQFIKSGLNAFP
jgi:hypothetical protein